MFSASSFCQAVLECSYEKVSQRINKDTYKQFKIPKNGGTRTINYVEKNTELWNLQNKLLINFLNKQVLPICVKGFIRGESYKSFLSEHIGSNFFLRVDISSFFPSITKVQIKREIGKLFSLDSGNDKEKILDLICDIVTLNGSLPQGACTSPMISNIVMARIDQRITKYCQLFNVKYTRYADDLLFSSKEFDFKSKKWFLRKVKYILSSQKLKLNHSKIKFSERKLVLNGYIITSNGISLSRRRLSDIRHVVSFAKNKQELFRSGNSEKFLQELNGLSLRHRDLIKYPFMTVFQFIQYMCGYRAFLISVIDKNYYNRPFQKQIRHLIDKLEKQIIFYT